MFATVMKASQPIQHCVDCAPCNVAAECTDEHLVYFGLSTAANAEGTGNGQNHHQPKKDLRDPLHRIEETANRVRGFFWHRVPSRSFCFPGNHCGCELTLVAGFPKFATAVSRLKYMPWRPRVWPS